MRALLVVLLLAACGADPPTSPPPPGVTVQYGAPAPATLAASTELPLSGDVERIGATGAGTPVAITGGDVFEIVGASVVRRSLYAAPGDPLALGAAHAIAPRVSRGAWIAAGNGVFALDGLYVTHVAIDVDSPRAIAEVGPGALEGLWIGGSTGLFHRTPAGHLERLDAEGAVLSVRALAIGASAGLILEEDGTLGLLGADLSLAPLPEDAGAVHAISAGKDVLWAATEQGLLRFSNDAWTRFALAVDHAVPVLAVAADPMTGDAWARTSDGLVRATAAGVLTALPGSVGGAELVIDGLGHAWSSNGSALVRTSVGDAMSVTFQADVRPWIAANCTQCHTNPSFEDFAIFSQRAELALSRVRAGDMPRCEGGLPCPEERRLKDHSVLESWIRRGKPE